MEKNFNVIHGNFKVKEDKVDKSKALIEYLKEIIAEIEMASKNEDINIEKALLIFNYSGGDNPYEYGTFNLTVEDAVYILEKVKMNLLLKR